MESLAKRKCLLEEVPVSGKRERGADDEQLLKGSPARLRNSELHSRESMAAADGSLTSPESPWVVVGGGPGGKRIIRGELSITWRLAVCITLLDETVS